MPERSAIETKLAAARTRLILDKPFLGALVLRLPIEAADSGWCPTTATDARKFYYNAEYIEQLSIEETQFMLAHEALHCALSHFARRQHRTQHRWDLACDFAINPLLVDDGLKPPPNALLMAEYKGLTAEEIYPLIDDDDDSETLDRHAYDRDPQSQTQDSGRREHDLQAADRDPQDPQPSPKNREQGGPSPRSRGGGETEATPRAQTDSEARSGATPEPEPLSPGERETLSIQWQQRMAGAAQQAMQAGKLSGALARMIEHLLQPQLPWRMLLARYMTALARDDYTYMRPSRREGAYILPSLRSTQIDVVVAVDTSGSIKKREIAEFLSEIDAIKGQMRARITLLACDSELAEGSPWVFEPWEEFKLPATITGGGGTDFRPVYHWIDRHGVRPELLVYFTDAEGPCPEQEPAYPVIWLVKGKEKVPWGQRIQLN